ncbi:MAG: hypothetical protein ACJ735_05375 [Actinomycetes bacterium]
MRETPDGGIRVGAVAVHKSLDPSAQTAALPKWLAIVTIVLGVCNIAGPLGIAVFFATPFWLIITGIVLSRRLSSSSSAAPAPSYAGVTA